MLEIILLAIVQGLTEFLPISSSGHLVIIPKLFAFKDPGLAFDAFLHLGTLAAVVIYFRKDIIGLLDKSKHKLALAIFIATIPAVVCGFALKSLIASDFVRSVDFIAYTLIAGSILMFAADKSAKAKISIQEMSFTKTIFVGFMQCLALMPGVSRSGSTISGAMFMGLKREDAARFSFLLGLPAVAGAGLLAVKDMMEAGFADIAVENLVIGFIVSFVSGYLAIDFLIKFLQKQSMTVFVVYRLLLAVYLLICF